LDLRAADFKAGSNGKGDKDGLERGTGGAGGEYEGVNAPGVEVHRKGSPSQVGYKGGL